MCIPILSLVFITECYYITFLFDLWSVFVCGNLNYHPTLILDMENLEENIRAEQVKTVLENMRAELRFQCFLAEKKVFLYNSLVVSERNFEEKNLI